MGAIQYRRLAAKACRRANNRFEKPILFIETGCHKHMYAPVTNSHRIFRRLWGIGTASSEIQVQILADAFVAW